MLGALVEALVDRHVDVKLRRLGRREPYPIHNERPMRSRRPRCAAPGPRAARRAGRGGGSAAGGDGGADALSVRRGKAARIGEDDDEGTGMRWWGREG